MNRLTTVLTAVAQHIELCGLTDATHFTAPDLHHDAVIQLASDNLCQSSNQLLTWAATLVDPSAHAWRPPHGHRVHVDIIGTISNDIVVRVYIGVAFDPARFPDLEPDGQQSVGMSVLRAWAAEAVAA
ncbi:hypothetical protein [Actinokineospora inagensis]|uniref:hypothetical protein n=1 Tax=Actinokineospora inagensis TaxID=103730 RepID=UPI0004220875|nr:hypothetical protein [Actinokineospora inagensis]